MVGLGGGGLLGLGGRGGGGRFERRGWGLRVGIGRKRDV